MAVEFVGSVPTEYDVGALELVVGGRLVYRNGYIHITRCNVYFHIYPVPTGYDVGALEEVVGAWSTENLRRF